MSKIIFIVFFSCLSTCFAYEQFITFWADYYFTGDSLTLKSKHKDNTNYGEFIANSKSYSKRGYWTLYDDKNFVGNQIGHYSDNVRFFGNYTWLVSTSLRFHGALDTSVPSISLYNKWGLSGLERVITTPTANDFGYTPQSFFTTGHSNWTFFSGGNFDGNSTCYMSTQENHYVNVLSDTMANINSVIRGCIDSADKYISGKNINIPSSIIVPA